MYRFEYWQDKTNGLWYWRFLWLTRPRTVAVSTMGYETEEDCLESIDQVKRYAPSASVFPRDN